jgi:hypothetical protein
MDDRDWNELNALRLSLNANLMAYDATTQEKFTELLVESLEGKGDLPIRTVSRT